MNIKDKDIDKLIDEALKEDLTLPEGLSERLEQAWPPDRRQAKGKKARKISTPAPTGSMR